MNDKMNYPPVGACLSALFALWALRGAHCHPEKSFPGDLSDGLFTYSMYPWLARPQWWGRAGGEEVLISGSSRGLRVEESLGCCSGSMLYPNEHITHNVLTGALFS